MGGLKSAFWFLIWFNLVFKIWHLVLGNQIIKSLAVLNDTNPSFFLNLEKIRILSNGAHLASPKYALKVTRTKIEVTVEEYFISLINCHPVLAHTYNTLPHIHKFFQIQRHKFMRKISDLRMIKIFRTIFSGALKGRRFWVESFDTGST